MTTGRLRTKYLAIEIKTCSGCGETKDISFFVKSKAHRDGYHGVCKPCRNKQRLGKPRLGDPRTGKTWRLRKDYGITLEDFEVILESQGGRCAICRREPGSRDKGVLHVDHDHVTGDIRGLLCSTCNVGLGHFNDSPELLEEAIKYLGAGQPNGNT